MVRLIDQNDVILSVGEGREVHVWVLLAIVERVLVWVLLLFLVLGYVCGRVDAVVSWGHVMLRALALLDLSSQEALTEAQVGVVVLGLSL